MSPITTAPPPPTTRGLRAAPPGRAPRRRLGFQAPRRQRTGAPWAGIPAAAIFALVVFVLFDGVLAPRWQDARPSEGDARTTPETITYVTPPASEPEAAEPATRETEPTPPTAPRVTPAGPGPVAPTRGDTSAVRRPAAPGVGDEPAAPVGGVLPLPRIPSPLSGEGEGAAAPVCWPPCLEGRAGPGRGAPPLTAAQRDSVLRAMGEGIAREGQQSPQGPRLTVPGAGSPAAPATVGAGVSLPVGLPGGGPTRAQRQRDSTLNADVQARLARIRARQDSIDQARRRDSIAAARRENP